MKSDVWGFDKSGEEDLISRVIEEEEFDFKFFIDGSTTAETTAI